MTRLRNLIHARDPRPPRTQVRGTENLPIRVPGSNMPLPITARLHLQKNDWAIAEPAEHVPVV